MPDALRECIRDSLPAGTRQLQCLYLLLSGGTPMNQSELNALLGKTVLIRGGEHFCCAVGNDRLLLLQCAAKDEPLFRKGEPVQYIVA